MKTYIGTKIIKSTPMTRGAYNTYRNWTLPDNEDGSDEGYLVEYTDGGKPNDPRHAGYISWSPKEQHENAYRETTGLSFGLAVEALKKGLRVTRTGWNGKGMWLELVVPSHSYNPAHPTAALGVVKLPWIGIKTVSNKFVPWTASQSDVLADDWFVCEEME